MELLKKNFEFGCITYLVCSNGDVFRQTAKQLKARENGDGYAVVAMGNKRVKRSTQFVHRIYGILFLEKQRKKKHGFTRKLWKVL